MKMLIKFPTRGRPQKFLRVLGLYREMLASKEVETEFIISCDADDGTMNNPTMKQTLAEIPNLQVFFGNSKTKMEAINTDMDDANPWDILLLASDDMIPERKGYDDIICAKMKEHFPDFDGVLWFNDGSVGKALNTLVLMGRRYYDRFGYIYHLEYKGLWCDNEFTDVAKILGKQVFIDEVIIRHRHPAFCPDVKNDSIYDASGQYHAVDHETYKRRRKRRFDLEDLKLLPRAKLPLLSVLICTMHHRRSVFEHLQTKLFKQIEACGEQDIVEVLNLADDGTMQTGRKRNLLVERARGEYACFVDDDDDVAPTYIEDIVRVLRGCKVDAVGLQGKVLWGGRWKPFRCSREYKDFSESKDGFWRPINHLCPVRRSILLQHPFPPGKTVGEDSDFTMSLVASGAIKIQAMIEKPLYFYNPHSHSPKKPKGQKSRVPDPMPELVYGTAIVALYSRDKKLLLEGTGLCREHDSPANRKIIVRKGGRKSKSYFASWLKTLPRQPAICVCCPPQPVIETPAKGEEKAKVYSQNNEQNVVVRLLGKRKGKFLDIGANDGRTLSNTYRLFELGWDGVCVEPNPHSLNLLMDTYLGQAKRVTVVGVAILPETGFSKFHASQNMVSTFSEQHKELWKKTVKSKGDEYKPVELYGVSVEDFLKNFPGPYLMVNIDVEGGNWGVLQQMPLSDLGVEVLCIEHENQLKAMDAYCKQHGLERESVNGENAIYTRKKK